MGSVQNAVSEVEVWSQQNKMQLNEDKCKERVIGFKKNSHNSFRVVVSGKELPVCSNVKVLCKLEMERACNRARKESKKASVLHRLKRGNVTSSGIVAFYCTTCPLDLS